LKLSKQGSKKGEVLYSIKEKPDEKRRGKLISDGESSHDDETNSSSDSSSVEERCLLFFN